MVEFVDAVVVDAAVVRPRWLVYVARVVPLDRDASAVGEDFFAVPGARAAFRRGSVRFPSDDARIGGSRGDEVSEAPEWPRGADDREREGVLRRDVGDDERVEHDGRDQDERARAQETARRRPGHAPPVAEKSLRIRRCAEREAGGQMGWCQLWGLFVGTWRGIWNVRGWNEGIVHEGMVYVRRCPPTSRRSWARGARPAGPMGSTTEP